MFPDEFLGSSARQLLHQLEQLSDTDFRSSARTSHFVAAGPDTAAPLHSLTFPHTFIVDQLSELTSLVHGTKAQLTWDNFVKPGYDDFARHFNQLLSMRWLRQHAIVFPGMAAEVGQYHIAFGIGRVDLRVIEEVRTSLHKAEESIRDATLPDLRDECMVGYLTNDLSAAGIPLVGLCSPIASEADTSSFAGPCLFFEIDDGRRVRVDLRDDVELTGSQHSDASGIIRNHFRTVERLNRLCTSVGAQLRRLGHAVSLVHFVRNERELGHPPERSVSVKADDGYFEVLTRNPLDSEARHKISAAMRERLTSERISAVDDLDVLSDPARLVDQILRRFHSSAQALLRRRAGKLQFPMDDEYDVQDLLEAILVSIFVDVVRESRIPEHAGRGTQVDFRLRNSGILIEVKRPRNSQTQASVADDLLSDAARYQANEDGGVLFFFVFDPEKRIRNPSVFEEDLNRTSSTVRIRTIVNQQG